MSVISMQSAHFFLEAYTAWNLIHDVLLPGLATRRSRSGVYILADCWEPLKECIPEASFVSNSRKTGTANGIMMTKRGH